MSIVSSTRCGILSCNLTDEIVQQKLGFNNQVFRNFGHFYGIGYGSLEHSTFIHKDYPNLAISKITLVKDKYFYYITYTPLIDVFDRVPMTDWKNFQQTPEYLRFSTVAFEYVYCGNNLVNTGYDVLNFIEQHKSFLERSAKSIYEAANFLIHNSNKYRGIKL